jgi:DNA-directed RNA polymerase sigma subunit (sigma70/sigma32)
MDSPIKSSIEMHGAKKTLHDILYNNDEESENDQKNLSDLLDKALHKITKQEDIILRMSFGINLPRKFTSEEIVEELKLKYSPKYLGALKSKALKKMAKILKAQEI